MPRGGRGKKSTAKEMSRDPLFCLRTMLCSLTEDAERIKNQTISNQNKITHHSVPQRLWGEKKVRQTIT